MREEKRTDPITGREELHIYCTPEERNRHDAANRGLEDKVVLIYHVSWPDDDPAPEPLAEAKARAAKPIVGYWYRSGILPLAECLACWGDRDPVAHDDIREGEAQNADDMIQTEYTCHKCGEPIGWTPDGEKPD